MKQGKSLPDWMRRTSVTGMLLLLGSVAGWSQESSSAVASSQSDSTAAAIHELQQEVKELRSAMAEMRSETEQYRAENAALRREIRGARGPSEATLRSPQNSYPSTAPADSDPPPAQTAPPKQIRLHH